MAAYPIRSMTGYARSERETAWGTLQLELRSVNHRYLELAVRTGDELRSVESILRTQLKDRLARGKVEAQMRLRPNAAGGGALDVDLAVLEPVVAACRDIAARLPSGGQLDPLNLLHWPGVLREPELDTDALGADVLALANATLDQLCATRGEEGDRTAAVLRQRLDAIDDLLAKVVARLPVQGQMWREKLNQRLEEFSDMESERREQALVQFVQRLDVDEEIERLRSHCTAVRDLLQQDEPVGRKLDFFMQEFNREANTLGSKSMDAELTALAVELKVVIEQMREQVQNIE